MTSKIPTINTDLNATALVAIFNDLSDHPVKKFADKRTALKRVEVLLEKNGKRVDPDETEGWKIVGAKKRQRKEKRSTKSRRRVTEPRFVQFIAEVGLGLRARANSAGSIEAAAAIGSIAEFFETFDTSVLFPE